MDSAGDKNADPHAKKHSTCAVGFRTERMSFMIAIIYARKSTNQISVSEKKE